MKGMDYPAMMIYINGDCDCKWPNSPKPGTEPVDSFALTITVPLSATTSGFAANKRTVTYEIDAVCCPNDSEDEDDESNENVLWQEDGLLLGTNSYFCYDNLGDGNNYVKYNLGAQVNYKLSTNHMVGASVGFQQETSTFSSFKDRTNLLTVMPSYTYLSPCSHPCFSGSQFRTGITLEGVIGTGNVVGESDGVELFSDNLTRLGISVNPTLFWNPCERLYVNLAMPLFSWQQNRFSNDLVDEPIVQDQTSFFLNKNAASLGVNLSF